MKLAVIGAGMSGLSIANMLRHSADVVVFEQKEKAGGLIRCERVQDCLFHKVGGHVFNSRNQQVLDWFWSYFDRDAEFIMARRNAKIYFDHRIIGYPVENYLYLLNRELVSRIIGELAALEKREKKSPFEYPHFESFLRNNLGDTLFDLYFQPYNKKIWQTDLSRVPMEWLEGKLPMPDFASIVVSNIVREEETTMVHASFYYPRENGSQFIIDRLSAGLTIRKDTVITDFKKQDGKFVLPAGDNFDAIVYCGDVRKLPLYARQLAVRNGIDIAYIEALASNGTSNLFCETDDTDISWLYIPENFTRAHRIIYTGNFSNTNNRGSKRKTCVVEFSGKVEYATMLEEIKKLPGNLHPLACNYEPNSYVVQDNNTRRAIAQLKAVLEKEHIYLMGRFAEWEYYNMDKCIERAFQLAGQLKKQVASAVL